MYRWRHENMCAGEAWNGWWLDGKHVQLYMENMCISIWMENRWGLENVCIYIWVVIGWNGWWLDGMGGGLQNKIKNKQMGKGMSGHRRVPRYSELPFWVKRASSSLIARWGSVWDLGFSVWVRNFWQKCFLFTGKSWRIPLYYVLTKPIRIDPGWACQSQSNIQDT